MEQLVFLLIIGAISLINWLVRKSQEAREAQQQQQADEESEPIRRPPVRSQKTQESDAERVRRFLEALGIPEGEAPPPPVVPAPVARERSAEETGRPGPRPATIPRREPLVPPTPPLPSALPKASAQERPRVPPKRPELAEGPGGPSLVPRSTGRGVSGTVNAPAYTTEHLEPMRDHSAREHSEDRPRKAHPLADWLATRESLRAAVLAREILGAPRALAPFEPGTNR